MRYLLDTTFLVDVLRRLPAALDRLDRLHDDGDEPIVSSVITAELWSGRRPGTDTTIEAALRYLEYVHAGPRTARRAGEWRAAARESGRTLTTADALIAATAFDVGAAVLTRNVRDLALTPVRIETY
jgi:predicted nucleic acid-binding protein